jgi:hypothetical protein
MLNRREPIRRSAEQGRERYCAPTLVPPEAERSGAIMIIAILFELFLSRNPDPAGAEDLFGPPIIGRRNGNGRLIDRMLSGRRAPQASGDQGMLEPLARPVSACPHGRLGTIVSDLMFQKHT